MSDALSPIQNHILSKLKNAKSLRYSQLQPTKKIANDLFNYHLQFLVKKGYIKKVSGGYALDKLGIRQVHDPYALTPDKTGILFKFNVITIVSRVSGKKIEILNQLRQSHPSFGKIGVPGGVVRKGESVEAAACRKLREETGLEADFKLVGIQRRMIYKDGELFADMLFPIAYADNYRGTLIEDSEFGKNMWVNIDQAIKNESIEYDSLKKIVDVLKAIKKGTIKKLPFFYEELTQHPTK
jgi:hypothetical protein